MVEKNKPGIFLNDGSILPWERPCKPGVYSLIHMYNGSTNLVEQVGLDLVYENVGPFRVVASAIKYLADIIHLDDTRFKLEPEVTGESKREVLFSGSLAIYREGKIPGTELLGFDLETDGKIWVARNPEERYLSVDGLRNVLFDGLPDPTERIEAIISGYQIQEDNADRAENNARHESWQNGHSQGRSEGPVYGSGPC